MRQRLSWWTRFAQAVRQSFSQTCSHAGRSDGLTTTWKSSAARSAHFLIWNSNFHLQQLLTLFHTLFRLSSLREFRSCLSQRSLCCAGLRKHLTPRNCRRHWQQIGSYFDSKLSRYLQRSGLIGKACVSGIGALNQSDNPAPLSNRTAQEGSDASVAVRAHPGCATWRLCHGTAFGVRRPVAAFPGGATCRPARSAFSGVANTHAPRFAGNPTACEAEGCPLLTATSRLRKAMTSPRTPKPANRPAPSYRIT